MMGTYWLFRVLVSATYALSVHVTAAPPTLMYDNPSPFAAFSEGSCYPNIGPSSLLITGLVGLEASGSHSLGLLREQPWFEWSLSTYPVFQCVHTWWLATFYVPCSF